MTVSENNFQSSVSNHCTVMVEAAAALRPTPPTSASWHHGLFSQSACTNKENKLRYFDFASMRFPIHHSLSWDCRVAYKVATNEQMNFYQM